MKKCPLFSRITMHSGFSMLLLVFMISLKIYGAGDFRHKRDSLLALVQDNNTIEEGHLRCQLGSLYYRNFQFEEGLKQAKLALKTSISKNDEKLIIRAHRLHADLYYALAEYELSLKHFEAELKIHEKRNDRQKIAEVQCNIGVIYDVRGYLEKGLYHYLKALKIYEKLDEKEGLVATLSNLAFIYKGQGNYLESIRYFERASRIEEEHLTQQKPHYFIVNMAEDWVSLKQFERALEHLTKADSIIQSIENPDDEDILIWLDQMRILGDVYLNTERTLQAMEAYKKALELSRRSGYKEKEGPVLVRMGDLLKRTGRYQEAEKILLRALDIAKEAGSLSMQRYACQQLAEVADKQKQPEKAYIYLKQYNSLNDSIITKESALRMSDMRALYEAQKKESQIKLLVQENKIQQLNAQKNKNRLVSSILTAKFLMLAAGLFYTRYKLKARTSKLLEKKNLQLVDLNATKDKFFAIIAHDLKNPVTSFQKISHSLDRNLEVIKPEDLRYYMKELSGAAGHLNQMLGNLLQWARSQRNQINIEWTQTTPELLIRQACDDVASGAALKNQTIIVNNPHNPSFVTDRNIVVTILRNILSNAIKFSPENSSVFINVSNHSNEVLMVVEDQGPGIKPEDIDSLFKINRQRNSLTNSTKAGSGLGLILCAELIQKINGSIRAESEPGKGSRFFISLPLSSELQSR